MQTLEQIRKSRGVTKAAVRRHLGITQPTYDKYEQNPGCMSVSDFNKVCEFLHCKTSDVFLDMNHN